MSTDCLWASRPTKLVGTSFHNCKLADAVIVRHGPEDSELPKLGNQSGRRRTYLRKEFAAAQLSDCNFRSADLSRVIFRRLKLSGSDLTHATLKGCDLSDSDIQGLDLSHCDLLNANLHAVRYDSTTLLPEGYRLPDDAVDSDELRREADRKSKSADRAALTVLLLVVLGITLVVAVSALNSQANKSKPHSQPRDTAPPISHAPKTQPDIASGDQHDRPEQLTNSIGMAFRLIPAGSFMMGSPPTDRHRQPDEGPQHMVQVSDSFYMQTTEVTRQQWSRIMQTTPWNRDGGARSLRDAPAAGISWTQAVRFCERLSHRDQLTYRLPTEAEWEYACRAGTTTIYSCGDDLECLAEHGNVADLQAKRVWTEEKKVGRWFLSESDGHAFLAPVASYQPNEFGLFDMHGNLWEWCQDVYFVGYYRKSPASDPQGPNPRTGLGERHVMRGGSFYSRPGDTRSAARGKNYRAADDISYGFRCVITIP